MTPSQDPRAAQINRLCVTMGQPTRAAAFIAAGDTPSKVEALLKRDADAARRSAAEASAAGRANMARTLKAMGLKPVEDPGAGLPPTQADMARRVAAMSR